MNLSRPHAALVSYVFRFKLLVRRLLPRARCFAFGKKSEEKLSRIEKIYVINLDREPGRWSKIKQELRNIFDCKGVEVLELTDRHVAVDANDFSQIPSKDAEIDPCYTLQEQLFVEPQPLVFPTHLELNAPIRMSLAECAVARSHINAWRQVAASNHAYVLILEDDVWFHSRFAVQLGIIWNETVLQNDMSANFDILYLSYCEVKHGAPKIILSRNVFRPLRGLWHLSGYVLSKVGAEKLLNLLPCRGPIDLWINHHFEVLNVLAAKRSLISQRRDTKSSNSYSILPALTTIGAITSEGASSFKIRPTQHPVFAFGPEGSGHTSLAMALSMLGYRCCSDFNDLPASEISRLLEGKGANVFNAYVNIGSLYTKVDELKIRYPKAKFFLTTNEGIPEATLHTTQNIWRDSELAILHSEEMNKWKVICEHLRCAPPTCLYPILKDFGQRHIRSEPSKTKQVKNLKQPKRDSSPWVIERARLWQGISSGVTDDKQTNKGTLVKIIDYLKYHDPGLWHLRRDTFTDNLALFRPSNVDYSQRAGAVLSVKAEPLGVRDYSAASISSHNQYLFGRFEATIQASNVPGVVTGFFLHRNSPRQEIDIEIAGNRPDRLLINVFYNPGSAGANFEFGYRGSPSYIDLGFDSSKASHCYAIEWRPCEISWFVDGSLVHKRVIWDPTPIPHLPMTLHVNTWVSRSTQLAGRIDNQRLPTSAIVSKIVLEANVAVPQPEANDLPTQAKLSNTNSSKFVQ